LGERIWKGVVCLGVRRKQISSKVVDQVGTLIGVVVGEG
jgi:hypothetical protein